MENLYVYLALALASLLVVLVRRRRTAMHGMKDALRLPPSPWALPIIGHLHHLAGALPHRAMRALSLRHGPVMLLRLGEVPTLVVSSRDGAREVMKTHDTAFASRPLSASVRAISNGGRGIVFAPYGDRWRHLRKIAVMELLTARRVVSFRAVREEEVASMLRGVAAAAARPVEMRARLSTLTSDTTARIAMGDRCKDRDLFLRKLERCIELVAGFNPADLWPSSRLAGLVSGAVQQAKECKDTVYEILDGVIQEHLARLGDGHAEDLLDVLLKIQKDDGLQFAVDMDDIKAVIFEVFAAGTETTSTTLGWVIAELIRNPRVMEKATAEVRRAFESGGEVVEGRLGDLPYLQLVIRETFRLHSPVPLLLPRECREPCKVLGYDVPLGTQVVVNVWALGRDERYWDAPEEFRPERFQTGATADFRGVDFELLPFGAGRRMCPGAAFGLTFVEYTLACLLLHFDWEAPPGLADPAQFDMTEAFGMTSRRKADLLLRPILRVPLPAA
uniref:Uncharacterized protein n=1 Tax=Avena sativa TaxID=4498 RepID=A0ACD5ZIE8_AVESA